jgi:HlyD family secretion protein
MASIVNQASVKPVKSKKQKSQGRMALIMLALLVIGVGVAYQTLLGSDETYTLSDYSTAVVTELDLVLTSQASGTVQLPNQIIVTSPDDGYSNKLLVDLGDTVTKGQILAEIDVEDLDDDIRDYEAELITARIDREQVILAHENELENYAFDIKTIKRDIEDLEEDEATYIKLVEINNARDSDLEDIQDDLETKREELETAERNLKQSKTMYVINLKESEAMIAQKSLTLERAQKELEDTFIKSPMAGDILEITDEVSVAGSTLNFGDELFTIADPTSVVFDLSISEEYSGDIAEGDKVKVSVGSLNVTGTITSIGRVAETSDDGLGASVAVDVTPDEYNSSFLQGSTAIGVFSLGVEENTLTLPRGAYITTGAQKYVYVINGDRAVKTSVTFGEIEGNIVQILTGLNAGDQIITSGYQNFISFNEIKLSGE